jgi:hypothetical protein
MEAFWKTIEKLDFAAFRALDRVDSWLGNDKYRARIEKEVEHVRPAQKAIRFEN